MIETYFNVAGGPTPPPTFANSIGYLNPDYDWAITTPNAPSLVINDNLTVLLWVKGAKADYQDIIPQILWAKAWILSPSPHDGYSWEIAKAFTGGTTSNMEVRVDGLGGGIKLYVGSQTVWDNNWHMIGFRFSGGTLDLFVDGVKDLSPTKIDDSVFTMINDGSDAGFAPITLGAFYWPSNGGYVDDYVGNADEPAIWNTALTDNQISSLYNNGSPVNLKTATGNANLQLWYRMGDDPRDNNTTVYDQTSNANDGAWQDQEHFTLDGRQYQNDVPGDAPIFDRTSLSFNGTNTYLTAPSSASLNPTSAVSLSFWVKGNSGSEAGLVGKANIGAGHRQYFAERYFADGTKAAFFVSDTGGSISPLVTTATVFNGSWNHVVFTFGNATGGFTVTSYVNGVLDNSGSIGISSLFTSSAQLVIGAFANNSSFELFFDGKLNDVWVFSNELTSAQVTSIYNSGKPKNNSAIGSPISGYEFELTSADSFGTNNLTNFNNNAIYALDVP